MSGRWRAELVVILVVASFAVGCLPGSEAMTTPGEQEAVLEMTVAGPVEPDSLDPAGALSPAAVQVMNFLYDQLVTYDPQGRIVPALAETWDISADGMTLSLNIRRDVRFHCGRQLDGAAVVFSLERQLARDSGSVGAADLEAVDALELADPWTVVIRLNRPAPFLLQALATAHHSPVCPEAVKEAGKRYGTEVVCGTGPFALEEWWRGHRIVLRRNDAYAWAPSFVGRAGPAVSARLTFLPVASDAERLRLLQAGLADMVYGVPYDRVAALRHDPGVRLVVRPGGGVKCLVFNTEREPFTSDGARRGFARAVDRERLCREALGGLEDPAWSLVAPANLGFVDWRGAADGAFDPEEARRLLGNLVEPVVLTYPDARPFVDMALALRGELAELGIRLALEARSGDDWSAALRSGGYQVALFSYDWSTPEVLRWLFHSAMIGRTNFCFFESPELDAMLDAAGTAPDAAGAAERYRVAQEEIIRRAICVPLSNNVFVAATSRALRGYIAGAHERGWSFLNAWRAVKVCPAGGVGHVQGE